VWRAINGMPAIVAPAPAAPAAATAALATVQAQAPLNAKDGKHEFSNPVVYGLMGLLALTLGCIGWLWLHVRKGTQPGYGWLEESASAAEHLPDEPNFMPTTFTEAAPLAEVAPSVETPIDIPVDTPVGTPSVPSRLVPSKQAPVMPEVAKPEFETSRFSLVEAAASISPVAALVPNKEAVVLKTPTSIKSITKTQASNEFSAANYPEKSPAHFEDSRFDERHLYAQKTEARSAHDRTITSPAESIDMVLVDTPPKLRSVPNQTPSVEDVKEAITFEAFTEQEKTALQAAIATAKPADKPVAKPLDFEPDFQITTSKPEVKTKTTATFKTAVEAKTELKTEPKTETKPASESKSESKGNLIDFDVFAEPVPRKKPSRFGG
jgi:hypothetical protein